MGWPESDKSQIVIKNMIMKFAGYCLCLVLLHQSCAGAVKGKRARVLSSTTHDNPANTTLQLRPLLVELASASYRTRHMASDESDGNSWHSVFFLHCQTSDAAVAPGAAGTKAS